MSELESIEASLRKAGFKLTPQRRATVELLLKYQTQHLTAEEIYALLKQNHPNVGLATVYRTLDMLTDVQVVNKIIFEDGMVRFDLKTQDHGHFHHHLICNICGRVQEIHEDLLVDIEKEIKQKYRFEVADHRLTFLGICDRCRQKRIDKN
ncbi:Fur family transcriptional regulator, ferric uptake regulator [Ligilactobacillus sp. WC1T17]|uniref:Fur family transcriptional regulator, ferric uptake regulator n=1 Tax=Ligilactobacillus ruminis TaxID=1623 RepID=A0ABY1ABK6_9LACO|nr:Fur family transcriptional regulator, ferric uptake regulator [Ligilactobacillus ruminis]